MKLPKSVQILHATYSVQSVGLAELDDRVGDCCNLTHRIRICRDIPDDAQVETLWHEIKHAIHYHMGLTDKSKEEDFANLAAKGELAVLKANRAVLRLIVEFCES